MSTRIVISIDCIAEEWTRVIAEECTRVIGEEWTRVIGEEWTRVIGEEWTRVIGEEWTRVIGEEWTRVSPFPRSLFYLSRTLSSFPVPLYPPSLIFSPPTISIDQLKSHKIYMYLNIHRKLKWRSQQKSLKF